MSSVAANGHPPNDREQLTELDQLLAELNFARANASTQNQYAHTGSQHSEKTTVDVMVNPRVTVNGPPGQSPQPAASADGDSVFRFSRASVAAADQPNDGLHTPTQDLDKLMASIAQYRGPNNSSHLSSAPAQSLTAASPSSPSARFSPLIVTPSTPTGTSPTSGGMPKGILKNRSSSGGSSSPSPAGQQPVVSSLSPSSPSQLSPASQLNSLIGTLKQNMTAPTGDWPDSGRNGQNSLNERLSYGGSVPVSQLEDKGACAYCHKAVIGQVVTAMGQIFHPDHFICVHCQQPLSEQPFFEMDQKPYCEADYFELFAPKCAHCRGPIKDRIVRALNLDWHPEHFICAGCGKQLGSTEGYHEQEGQPFCQQCYEDNFAPNCASCHKPITTGFVSELGRHFHTECFVCAECGTSFNTSTLFQGPGGRPLCELDLHKLTGSLCYVCEQPIRGRCVTAMGHKFHPEHFTCSYCSSQLNQGTFKEHDSRPYCHSCYQMLFVAS